MVACNGLISLKSGKQATNKGQPLSTAAYSFWTPASSLLNDGTSNVVRGGARTERVVGKGTGTGLDHNSKSPDSIIKLATVVVTHLEQPKPITTTVPAAHWTHRHALHGLVAGAGEGQEL